MLIRTFITRWFIKLVTENKLSQQDATASVAALFKKRFGVEPHSVARIAGAGSDRIYFRVVAYGLTDVIATCGTNMAENEAFIYLAHHLRAAELPVPEVLAVSADGQTYLQSDLGDLSLFGAIKKGRISGEFSDEEVALLRSSLEMLAQVQFKGAESLDFGRCFPAAAMDDDMVDFDLNYFKYCFLKPCGIEFDEIALQSEFRIMHTELMERSVSADTFMVRDFQSRNVMVVGGKPFLIDFQGGRRGPVEYDVASFLWQAKANIPSALRMQLIEDYIVAARREGAMRFDEEAFRRSLPCFVLFRMLQTLGAYGFRGLTERKPHFLTSIPQAVRNLRGWLCESGLSDRFPCLTRIAAELEQLPVVCQIDLLNAIPQFDGLTVNVASFSYKKGLPVDLSGNGGGFVFDCRAIHNPGRYAEYMALTGRDVPVVEFIERNGEAAAFIDAAKPMVDASVRRYLSRGFTSLSVAFGCTGGQHRSVYCAEMMARHLADSFPNIRIVLWHREQGILEILGNR